ncbi:MAG: C-GCAxxG-C-C family protein [Candidatus Bathyarchaeota archaeon]|nr:C-GCAxxG-C-C family protein [Candidatus Bathyarchaeota archaeon]MDW8040929.1 C-GCAxxG-C-C family protein [Nitrososphaerota archaeon]
MGKEEEIVEKAVSIFMEGYLCAEAVLKTFAETQKIKCRNIPKIATGFGGGMGRTGFVCGALTGAVMAISLKYGRNTPSEAESYEKCSARIQQLFKGFNETFGSVFCRDLTDCDLTTEEGRQKFKEQQIKEKKCTRYVEKSMKMLLALTKE